METSSWIRDLLGPGPVVVIQPSPETLAQQAEQALRQGYQRATSTVSGWWDSITSPPLAKKTQDRLERTRADWMWHSSNSLGYTQRVPLPVESSERLLLPALSLAKVVRDQVLQHGGEELALHRPVTLALVALNLAAFAAPGGLPLREVCLSPYCVLEKQQWQRLLLPCVVHTDATHLVSNLAGALPDCLDLEASSGSELFALELLLLTASSHGLYVAWAWGQRRWLKASKAYYSVGAVGMSALAFALEVVAGERRDSQVLLLGVLPVPSRFMWAAQLALVHLLLPEASFPCHMSGVGAGLAYVYLISPVLGWLGIRPRRSGPRGMRGSSQFWGAGTTGGRVLEPFYHHQLHEARLQVLSGSCSARVSITLTHHDLKPGHDSSRGVFNSAGTETHTAWRPSCSSSLMASYPAGPALSKPRLQA
ncbi:hypothetical protein QJQ45_011059 [Haematococcus lacustris]|nr:hypothetical protein QJQ45_011059 [Haematococcus lacustris]